MSDDIDHWDEADREWVDRLSDYDPDKSEDHTPYEPHNGWDRFGE